MSNNITIGQVGEEIACLYLLNNKYKVIERNSRYPWGEIDIICRSKDGTLVFVEVKTLKTANNVSHSLSEQRLTPEDNLSRAKLEKVKRTAYLYTNNNPKLINDKRGWQIDLVAIEINCSRPSEMPVKELLKHCQIRHYENL